MGRGLKACLWEIASGILTTAVLSLIARYRLLPQNVLVLLTAVTIFMTIALITRMRSWGLLYTAGWLLGIWACYQLHLLSGWDILLYAVIPVLFLLLRIVNRTQKLLG